MMQQQTTPTTSRGKASNVLPFRPRQRAPRSKGRLGRAPEREKTVTRARADRKGEAVERAVRMKLRRMGHPAPPARPEPGGDYCLVTVKPGALAQYGYPTEHCFLVRRDAEPQPGELVLVEREPFMFEGQVSQFDTPEARTRFGLLGRNPDGSPGLESLTCGAYSFRLKRIIGKVVGPVTSPAVLAQFDIPAASPTPTAPPEDEEWPEYIYPEGDAP